MIISILLYFKLINIFFLLNFSLNILQHHREVTGDSKTNVFELHMQQLLYFFAHVCHKYIMCCGIHGWICMPQIHNMCCGIAMCHSSRHGFINTSSFREVVLNCAVGIYRIRSADGSGAISSPEK